MRIILISKKRFYSKMLLIFFYYSYKFDVDIRSRIFLGNSNESHRGQCSFSMKRKEKKLSVPAGLVNALLAVPCLM